MNCTLFKQRLSLIRDGMMMWTKASIVCHVAKATKTSTETSSSRHPLKGQNQSHANVTTVSSCCDASIVQMSKSTPAPFDLLPHETQYEILSFLYDDISTIDAYLKVWFSSSEAVFERHDKQHQRQQSLIRSELRRSIAFSILNHTSTTPNCSDVFCSICSVPVCYPYKLTDEKHCGKQACGRCVWIMHQSLRPVCGTRIRSRPQRLDPTLSNCRATWLLGEEENRKRVQRNERRVHRGYDGWFGADGTANSYDPFDRISFMEDYDSLRKVNVQQGDDCMRKILPPDFRRLWLVLCPSHENFKPYHIGFLDSVDDIQAVWPTLLQHKFFRSICEDDLVTLEECALQEEEVSGEICNNTNDSASKLKITSQERKRFEVRLVGWEHLAGDFANYDF